MDFFLHLTALGFLFSDVAIYIVSKKKDVANIELVTLNFGGMYETFYNWGCWLELLASKSCLLFQLTCSCPLMSEENSADEAKSVFTVPAFVRPPRLPPP